MKTIYVVEDDAFLAGSIADDIRDLGCKCETFANSAALMKRRGPAPVAVLVDLFIPCAATTYSARGARDKGDGIRLIRTVRQKWPKTRFVLMTGMPSADAREWCERNRVTYVTKPISCDAIERLLQLRRLRAFVVHGRDARAKAKVIQALKSAGIDPVVLIEQPSRGQTVIEKFEKVADTCDCAVVVWSPDDEGRIRRSRKASVKMARARQNVIFELGYFYGAIRRRTGRVIFLETGETELPSDLAGIVRIDARRSIANLVADLKNELSPLFE